MVNSDTDYKESLFAACKKQGVSPHGIGSYALQVTMETWAKWAPAPIVAAEMARRVDRMDGLEREQVDAIVADVRLEDPSKTQAPTNTLLARFRKATETDEPRRFGSVPDRETEPDAETKPDGVLRVELARLADEMHERGHRRLAEACDRRRKWIESGRPAGGPRAMRVGLQGVKVGRESIAAQNATD